MNRKNKNNTKNNISYAGNVTITSCKGKKPYKVTKVHNAGKGKLFEYIAECLAGNTSRVSPRYIHTFTQDMQGETLYSSSLSTCAYNIPMSSVRVKAEEDESYTAEITFMIAYNQISSYYNTQTLCLYNTPNFGDNIEPMAIIELDNDSKIRADEDNLSNFIITWELNISNASTTLPTEEEEEVIEEEIGENQ